MNFLEKIIQHKRFEVENFKKSLPQKDLISQTEKSILDKKHEIISMSQALYSSKTGIIAEFKRKSPSKNWINENAKVEKVVPEYEKQGASAVSILTDENFFGGSLGFVKNVRKLIKLPILRKDFIIDEYQLFQAREIGADAVLLIAAALSKNECLKFAKTARALGLETLLEIHSEQELDHLNEHINMVGVNNRNLETFETNVKTSLELSEKLPKEFVRVSESGIDNALIINELRAKGYRGFLIGENFMKQENPGNALGDFLKDLKKLR